MAKTYILEPMEITTDSTEGGSATSISATDELIAALLSSINSSPIAEVSEVVLNYAGVLYDALMFTPDGYLPTGATLPEHYLAIIRQDDILVFRMPEPAGTYTVSIYTETEDPEPEPTPSGGLTPVTREEHYLSAIAGLSELPSDMKPETRKEIFLDAILNGSGSSVTPVTREEMFLDAIANKE